MRARVKRPRRRTRDAGGVYWTWPCVLTDTQTFEAVIIKGFPSYDEIANPGCLWVLSVTWWMFLLASWSKEFSQVTQIKQALIKQSQTNSREWLEWVGLKREWVACRALCGGFWKHFHGFPISGSHCWAPAMGTTLVSSGTIVHTLWSRGPCVFPFPAY